MRCASVSFVNEFDRIARWKALELATMKAGERCERLYVQRQRIELYGSEKCGEAWCKRKEKITIMVRFLGTEMIVMCAAKPKNSKQLLESGTQSAHVHRQRREEKRRYKKRREIVEKK